MSCRENMMIFFLYPINKVWEKKEFYQSRPDRNSLEAQFISLATGYYPELGLLGGSLSFQWKPIAQGA